MYIRRECVIYTFVYSTCNRVKGLVVCVRALLVHRHRRDTVNTRAASASATKSVGTYN